MVRKRNSNNNGAFLSLINFSNLSYSYYKLFSKCPEKELIFLLLLIYIELNPILVYMVVAVRKRNIQNMQWSNFKCKLVT